MADRLVIAFSGPGAPNPVVSTVFVPLALNGAVIPVETLKSLIAKPKVQLWAWLLPPAGGSIEIQLAVQQDAVKLVPLPGTIVRATAPATGPVLMKLGGAAVEVTDLLKGDSLALRILARVSTGSGDVQIPTISVLGATG